MKSEDGDDEFLSCDDNEEFLSCDDNNGMEQVEEETKAKEIKREPIQCQFCQQKVWRISTHLKTAHNVSEEIAGEYRWRRPTKKPKKTCQICGVTRVRLDRHLKKFHPISNGDKRMQCLEVNPCLNFEKVTPLLHAGTPTVRTPPLFAERFNFLWADYADHIRRRIFTNVRSVEESVTRKVKEAVSIIQLVDRRGDLQKIFDINGTDGTPGDRFEAKAFSIITNELRTSTSVASTWANRLRSLIGFLNFLLVFKQTALEKLGISMQSIQNVLDRAKEFKTFAEKARSARTNILRQEQTSQIREIKRSLRDLRQDFDDALNHKNHYEWFVTARDSLMVLIADCNASRPGPIINMTLQEYENISYLEKDKIWLIRVTAHKTYHQFGPSTVFLEQQDKERLQEYMLNVRPMLSSRNPENFVFITKDTTVDGGRNTKGGRQFASSAFCKIQKRLMGYTTTYKRKKDSEKFRNSEMENNVSELMLHSIGTIVLSLQCRIDWLGSKL